ncbi:hypothetical protein [Myroides odoratus]|uniref:hypothetical protein n=1 Tax=Myroides odoratus TaxID=256 RepID=UPI00333FC0AE
MRFNQHYTQSICCNDNRRTFVLEETKGVQYIVSNTSNLDYIAYRVDRGLIQTNTTKQCDYALYIPSSDTVRFIELKGSNVEEGLEQLLQTIQVLITRPNITVSRLQARIITRKVKSPSIRSTKKTKLEKIVKEYRGDLVIKNITLTELVD